MSPSQNDPALSHGNDTRNLILGTAGHIDHGKTSLVRALTGVDTDRLPEEQRRGMTIELGFAELTLNDPNLPDQNYRFGIVDVPGHEKFIRTMVAGATGIDIGLLVVAADDSVMPQTIEHVEILQLLGVHRGVVAITKIDTVDSEMVELVIDDVKKLLEPYSFEVTAYCPVSSITNEGIDTLKQAVIDTAKSIEPADILGPFRLPIDRVFTVQGRGTVVTGSAMRGTVTSGDMLEVFPSGETCRVRGLHAHGQSCDSLHRSQRCAVNVSGIDRDLLQRGSELVTPGYLQPSHLLDVRLESLPTNTRILKSSTKVRLETGTSEIVCRVVLYEHKQLEPGESAYAQLRCSDPIATAYGQRFILRDENAVRTIGGGIILRPVARRKHRNQQENIESLKKLENGDKANRVEQVLTLHGFHTPSDLHLCAQAGVEPEELPELIHTLKENLRWMPIGDSDVYITPSALLQIKNRLIRWLERFHQKNPDSPGRPADAVEGWLERLTSQSVAKPLLEGFIKDKTLKRLGRFCCLPAFAPTLSAADEKILASMTEKILQGEFQPPTIDDLVTALKTDKKRIERLATLAVAMGELVKIDAKIYLHSNVQARLRQQVADLIGKNNGVTVAKVREKLESSRKFVIPFMEYLDRVGYTQRNGDQRFLSETASDE